MFDSDSSDNEESYSELEKKTKFLNFNTTTVDNNYYDEEIEVSDSESSKLINYHGDSPPTHPISDSEGEYDHSDDEDAHITLKSTGDLNYGGKYMDNSEDIEKSYGLIDNINEELNELFSYIDQYKPIDTKLDTELKPFIPDYIPAVGDIDAFIKIPRCDNAVDTLGLACVDEPSGNQSDPTVLDLRLRAITKSSSDADLKIRSIPSEDIKEDPKLIDTWVTNIDELHDSKPRPNVIYSRRMPDIEDLMQVWPTEIEEELNNIDLPSADLDLSLIDYIRLLLVLLDIPIHSDNLKLNELNKENSRTTIESLHVMFTLYSEFKNSQHFKAMKHIN
ncbi:hypothetical protein BCR32DRAFT_297873 [Anaeromyces robustus]|uniref:Intraflagellar transport protein 46 homolog n=1 Tax=Anaeromyces robustus TaxID=1754192 RepID=A0A1Y1VUH3_9FUNG|nr:hypothetical protein BCR32DRAFT_297873 [Anaeromyces robustus]|eukprot:ORX64942.1 hypothetical protein BCR32DRAFT_297873 [Anaeromyces robustus]